MNARPMFDPRMLERLRGFFVSTINIYETSNEPDSFGSPSEGLSIVEGLDGIPCSIGPFNDVIPISGERKLENISYNTSTRHVSLKGYYPQITDKMFTIFDDKTWNILGVESDSHNQTTRLIVNVVVI